MTALAPGAFILNAVEEGPRVLCRGSLGTFVAGGVRMPTSLLAPARTTRPARTATLRMSERAGWYLLDDVPPD